MIEMICPNCGKFLGVLEGEAQIKCPRCRLLNTFVSRPYTDSDEDSDQESDEEQSSAVH